FQAEDGIRDRNVTGVQTCALPIFQNPFSLRWERVLDYIFLNTQNLPGACSYPRKNDVISKIFFSFLFLIFYLTFLNGHLSSSFLPFLCSRNRENQSKYW